MKNCSLKRKVYFVKKGTCVCTYTIHFLLLEKSRFPINQLFKNTFVIGYLLMIIFNI